MQIWYFFVQREFQSPAFSDYPRGLFSSFNSCYFVSGGSLLSVDISPVFRILMRTRLPWASLGPGSEAGGGAAPRPVRSEATSDLISAPVPGGDQTFPCTVSLSCPLSSDEGQAFQRVRCLPSQQCSPGPGPTRNCTDAWSLLRVLGV